jgi:hypothetical protein
MLSISFNLTEDLPNTVFGFNTDLIPKRYRELWTLVHLDMVLTRA